MRVLGGSGVNAGHTYLPGSGIADLYVGSITVARPARRDTFERVAGVFEYHTTVQG
jgi:hypothetical protein